MYNDNDTVMDVEQCFMALLNMSDNAFEHVVILHDMDLLHDNAETAFQAVMALSED